MSAGPAAAAVQPQGDAAPAARRRAGRRGIWTLALAALATLAAGRWLWTCDDAFISFRYAANLLAGKGLVFNVGEAVEGATNALWTVWIAVGLGLGVAAEVWANVWGLTCFVGLVAWAAHNAPVGRWPWAAALLVASRPLQIWASGGLETAANLLLLVAGWHLTLTATTPRLAANAGAVLALASMTRPDSALVAGVCGLTLLATGGRGALKAQLRQAAGLSAGFVALWGPFMLWRFATYGSWVPNTYYAKSAHLSWWSQGATYVGLFVQELPALVLVLPLAAVGLWRGTDAQRLRLASALAVALAFALYVARVGGGFMHTRLLLPALPFAWLAAEQALETLPRRARLTTGALLVLTTALAPAALGPTESASGVVDERAHYDPQRAERLERDARVLRRFLADLPVRAAFIGGQARLVYRTEVPLAIEAETGLTDAWVARQPLAERGRVGHEKRAPPSYLVDRRRVHLVFGAYAFRYLGLQGYVPKVGVRLGHATVFLTTWDPALVAELRERGAQVPPFEAQARDLIAHPAKIPAPRRTATLASLRRFWPEGFAGRPQGSDAPAQQR